jgi:putative nucleotidyltransferase with HDIG domain
MFNGLIKTNQRKKVLCYTLAFIGAIIISGIIYSPQLPLNITLNANSESPITIRSPQFIEFQTNEDIKKTNQLIKQRKRLIEPIYTINHSIEKDVKEQIILFFNEIREIKQTNKNTDIFLSKQDLDKLINLNEEGLIEIELTTLTILNELLQEGIKEINFQLIDFKVTRRLKSSKESPEIKLISSLIKEFIEPNLLIDNKKTKEMVDKQVESIQGFVTTFKADQLIVSKGEVVTEFHLNVLNELKIYGSKANRFNFIGILIICCLLFLLFERFIYYFYSKIHNKISTYSLTYILLLIIIISSRALLEIPHIKFIDNLNFLIPLPVLVILLCVLLTPNIAMLSGAISAILISVMYQFDMHLFLFLFAATAATTFSCYKLFKRSDLMKAGNIIGGINILLIVTIGILNDITSITWFLYNGIIGFTNGLICAMLSFAFLPYFEGIFKITTSLGLLENANLNHPLLKKLMLNAPGTYQHSLMVANLSEAAAESIGADVVLARIGGYFHDIGKMKRPIFFSENQFSSGNPHSNLSPRMSKIIIAAHTKDGAEMAEKYKLPKVLQNLMLEHHGTTLVSFFYTIAKQEEHFDENDSTKEEFRYPGPKPQTKESGILLLADSTEASIRSIDKPTPSKVENLINKIFTDKINDDQLNESGLSLNDIETIKETFISIFKSIYHSRIDYEEELNKIIDQTKSKHNEE